ncbi:AAA-ATPase At5g57480-like [Eucalyptus grandis]|uniref:AAA-ATPase At5g57480-like n=1 Tax=Eucalyptus grandis TaxID=71139 RepID=UPI00192EC477|nr:AAA-ATPase At5g57480-like [Eucalyptus grandis]
MKEIWTSLASLPAVLAFFCRALLQVVFPPELRFASLPFLNRALLQVVFPPELRFASLPFLNRALLQVVFPPELRFASLPFLNRALDCFSSYLDSIINKANDIRRKNQERIFYTKCCGLGSRGHAWESVPFKHPSTFDTLAMDPKKKRDIMKDLRDFSAGQAFYQRTAQACKRVYLLSGLPGTGKSSVIFAIANFLGYDIYNLLLAEVHTYTELQNLLMKTSSKSIIVIEDFDCSLNLSNKSNATQAAARRSYYNPGAPEAARGGEDRHSNTISHMGLLNFTDSLCSCCQCERIFVFTTSDTENLDPEFLRSGLMDMHISMTYCSYPALQILLRNYLGTEAEDLGKAVARELQEAVEKAKMTPADISEVLIKNLGNKERAVSDLLGVLKARPNMVEEEEQVKRVLESPSEGSPGGELDDYEAELRTLM